MHIRAAKSGASATVDKGRDTKSDTGTTVETEMEGSVHQAQAEGSKPIAMSHSKALFQRAVRKVMVSVISISLSKRYSVLIIPRSKNHHISRTAYRLCARMQGARQQRCLPELFTEQ